MRIHALLIALLAATAAFGSLAIADEGGDGASEGRRGGERGGPGGGAAQDHRGRGGEGKGSADDDDGGDGDDDDRGGGKDDRRGKRGGHFGKLHDKWVIRNDEVTVWFHQGDRSKPVLAVFHTPEDGNRSGFLLQLDELFEVAPGKPARGDPEGEPDEDLGAEGGAGGNASDAGWHRVRGHRINLHPAREWWTSVVNGTDEVTVTMSHAFNQGNVTLVFHVPHDGPVKFDVQVQDWDWADPGNNSLALRMKVLGRGAAQRGPSATFDGGYVGWAEEAKVTYPDGTARTIPVEGMVRNHGHGAHIVLRFDAPGGYSSLDYDPTIGVVAQSGEVREVPGPWLGAALLAAGGSALVARRRRTTR